MKTLNTAQPVALSSRLYPRPPYAREAPFPEWQASAPWSTASRASDTGGNNDAATPGEMPNYLGVIFIVLFQVTMLWFII